MLVVGHQSRSPYSSVLFTQLLKFHYDSMIYQKKCQSKQTLSINSNDMINSYDTKAVIELVEFLSPEERLDAICRLCETSASDTSYTLLILTNFSAESNEVANFILTHSGCVQIAYDACQSHADFANNAARLLANLSRYFPDKTTDCPSLMGGRRRLPMRLKFANRITTDIFSSCGDDSLTLPIGYTLVNLSTLRSVRYQLVDYKCLSKICPLIMTEEKREVIADILRNLSFEDEIKLSSRVTKLSVIVIYEMGFFLHYDL
ncbi:hypothetical protein DICVIV_03119 [Dictyocaulus viviparus]|uniref:Armadillo repeat-containing domain-containing protein n=1 Tax=Dictyocaulus viviparus TaxID=29172 RepID=A0A0D8Y3M9_DICVI|nr:hypothetical protein DICVIV_03119 [Dictyocaulus viviparus]